MKIQRVLLLLCMAVCSMGPGLRASESAPEPQLPKKVKSAWKIARSYLLDNRVVRSTVIPVLMKIEKIKDEGISRTDVAKGAMYGALAYGVFKIAQSVMSSASSQSTKPQWFESARTFHTPRQAEKSSSFFTLNKVALAAFLAGYGYLCFEEERDHLRTDALAPFFRTFTDHQRAAVEQSDELKRVVRDAHLKPTLLQESGAFMALLSQEQKERLDSIIKDDTVSLDLLLEMAHHHHEHPSS